MKCFSDANYILSSKKDVSEGLTLQSL